MISSQATKGEVQQESNLENPRIVMRVVSMPDFNCDLLYDLLQLDQNFWRKLQGITLFLKTNLQGLQRVFISSSSYSSCAKRVISNTFKFGHSTRLAPVCDDRNTVPSATNSWSS